MQIARRGRGHRRCIALRVPGGDKAEFARGRAVEQPRTQHAVLDQRELLPGDAFGVERMRAQPAHAQRIVDDADAVGEQLLAHPVLQEAGLARDRGAVDGAGEMRTSEPATRGSNTTGTLRVLTLRGLRRATARSPRCGRFFPAIRGRRRAARRCNRSRAPCRCLRRRSRSSRRRGWSRDKRRGNRDW